jgi:hypothetical protein
MFFILQEGVEVVDPEYTAPFTALGPAVSQAGAGDYTNIPEWTGNALDSPPCQKAGLVNIRFPIDLKTYDAKAQRDVYDLFASTTKEVPALNGSLFLFEGYPLQGVQAIPSDSTAYPFRDNHLLVAPLLIYKEAGAALEKQARELGETLRQILFKASGMRSLDTYVNYAFGQETVENWYGSERWRQDKLRALKDKYDPERKFSFYAPIA